MNEEKDEQPEGSKQDVSADSDGWGSPFMRGCAIAVGVVLLIFFFIVGTCFLR